LPGDDGYKFQEGYGINTELTVCYISVTRLGTLKNTWGEGEDITQLGLEFKNSMVGTASVRLSYFLHRLVCTNGMMVPAATATSRVFHSGDQRSFPLRLANCFREVHRKLESMGDMLHQLGEIEFNSSRLAADSGLTERVFDIIPGAKQTLCDQYQDHLRYPKECPDAEKQRLKLAHDTKLLELIPDYYGREFSNSVFKSPYRKNASAFDFLNIFTEYAKGCPPAQRLEIQGKAGALAKYIGESAKKFSRKGEAQS
jgi:hypothetical protein